MLLIVYLSKSCPYYQYDIIVFWYFVNIKYAFTYIVLLLLVKIFSLPPFCFSKSLFLYFYIYLIFSHSRLCVYVWTTCTHTLLSKIWRKELFLVFCNFHIFSFWVPFCSKTWIKIDWLYIGVFKSLLYQFHKFLL